MKQLFSKVFLFSILCMALTVQEPQAFAQINLASIPSGETIEVVTEEFHSLLDYVTYGSDAHGFSTLDTSESQIKVRDFWENFDSRIYEKQIWSKNFIDIKVTASNPGKYTAVFYFCEYPTEADIRTIDIYQIKSASDIKTLFNNWHLLGSYNDVLEPYWLTKSLKIDSVGDVTFRVQNVGGDGFVTLTAFQLIPASKDPVFTEKFTYPVYTSIVKDTAYYDQDGNIIIRIKKQ